MMKYFSRDYIYLSKDLIADKINIPPNWMFIYTPSDVSGRAFSECFLSPALASDLPKFNFLKQSNLIPDRFELT